MRSAVVGGLLTMALLSGCSEKPQPREPENITVETVVEPPAPPPVEEAPAEKPPEPTQNSAAALPDEEPLAPDAQMLEDADATGLTARSAAPPDVVSEPSSDPVEAPLSGGLDSGAGQ